jgi:NADPH-dependent 2,4-dienoyl-CoA reductase/sulfur reductase-like enzyme
MPEPSVGSVFIAGDCGRILSRLGELQADRTGLWGKMDAAQMLAHCAVAIELPLSNPRRKQRLIGKLFAPLVRAKYLGDAPFPKSSPTDPAFIVSDRRTFDSEKARLLAVLEQFVGRGPEAADGTVHTFFGRLSGAEWGRLIYKHLDHHLRQFGV